MTDTTAAPTSATFSTTERDGKTFAPVDELENWDDNPRTASEQEIDRLAEEIATLGFYKPIIVSTDGEVLGGNMRLRALRQLDAEDVWVSIVDPADEDEKLEYALSDNDRVGHYEEDKLASLIQRRNIDIGKFKVDFYSPQDIAQNMARAMDPEDLLKKTSKKSESNGDDDGDTADESPATDTATDTAPADADDDDAKPRSLENLGQSANTAMVQLYMGSGEKEEFVDIVQDLKSVYAAETTADVVLEACRREHETHAAE